MLNRLEIKNKEFFTKWSKKYDYGILKSFIRKLQDRALEEISNTNNRLVLDIGCGTGELLLKLSKKYPKTKLFGVDLTKAMLFIAKKKLKANFIETNANSLPFKNNHFDYILSTEAFHHFSEPEKTLIEMKRVLKQNGKIIIIDIYFGPVLSYIIHLIEPGNKWIYSKKDFQKIFNKTSLNLIKQERISFFAILNILKK